MDNKLLTVTSSPHIKSEEKTRTLMTDVIIALFPALVWGIYVFGWRSLILTLLSVGSCVLFEFLYEKITHRPITVGDCSAVVTGILLAFNMPVSVPMWIPIIGGAFAMIVVKMLFGGIGKNVVNPALAARAFLFISWSSLMTGFTLPLQKTLSVFGISAGDISNITASATPLKSLKAGVSPADYSIFDMFIGNVPGCIGEVSALLLILGGLYLILRRTITWHIPVAYIGTVAVITFLFPKDMSVHAYQFMLQELFSGGLMLGAIFMATDYATSPVTRLGRIIYGVGCGLLTVFIRYFGGYSEGVSFAILIMNLLVWYIDMFTRPRVFGTSKKKKKKGV